VLRSETLDFVPGFTWTYRSFILECAKPSEHLTFTLEGSEVDPEKSTGEQT
jgi:hypothetical protein